MAWSDAARAAAAAARKSHADARKSNRRLSTSQFNNSKHTAGLVVRKDLARQIRQVRRGQYIGHSSVLVQRAARSTAIRNLLRKRK